MEWEKIANIDGNSRVITSSEPPPPHITTLSAKYVILCLINSKRQRLGISESQLDCDNLWIFQRFIMMGSRFFKGVKMIHFNKVYNIIYACQSSMFKFCGKSLKFCDTAKWLFANFAVIPWEF